MTPPAAIRTGFTPTATLRAAANLGNPILADRDAMGNQRGLCRDRGLLPGRGRLADNGVVVGKGSAYDLYLSRTLEHAQIVRSPTSPTVVATFPDGGAEVAAGVRPQLEADARRLGERFMESSRRWESRSAAGPMRRPVSPPLSQT